MKTFARMHQKYEVHCAQMSLKQRMEAQQDFCIKEVRNEFTYVYVNHVSVSKDMAEDIYYGSKEEKNLIKRDLSLMVCFDHRIKNDFG